MDTDREALRAKLRNKIQSKRSVRSANPGHSSQTKVEEVALSIAGSDANTLSTVMDLLKNPTRARDLLNTREVLNHVDDDDEAPPPEAT